MIKLKDLKMPIVEKQGYNMVKNPDSVWSRSSNARAGSKQDDEPNTQQAGFGDIADKMGFDIDPPHSVQDAKPLSLMDVIFNAWGLHGNDGVEIEDEDEEEYER